MTTQDNLTVATPTRSAGRQIQHGVAAVASLFVVGMIIASVVLARSIPDESNQSGATVGLTALLLFFAAGAIGAGLGFLFGLPRSRFVEQAAAGGDASPLASKPGSPSFLANSNLIKVSDWLTTIVIGLGLVNLARIGPAFNQLEENLIDPLGGTPNAGVIGVSIVLLALLAGALLMYLWTSIRVRELFEQSEDEIERSVPELVGSTVKEAKATMASTSLRLDLPAHAPDDAVIKRQSITPRTLAPAGATLTCEVEASPTVRTPDSRTSVTSSHNGQ